MVGDLGPFQGLGDNGKSKEHNKLRVAQWVESRIMLNYLSITIL